MFGRFLHWLKSESESERRSAPREPGDGLVAFYWEGDVPRGHRVRDISKRGAYVESDSISWLRGTLMVLTLQIDPVNQQSDAAADIIVLPVEVVRASPEGMGLRFLLHEFHERRKLLQFLHKWKAHSGLPQNGVCRPPVSNDRRGQSLVEFLLIFPLLFLLIVNVINFGTFVYAWITVSNAARGGAQYWITGASTVYAPSTPSEAQVAALITQDIASLPNNSSLKVEVCTLNMSGGSAVTTCSGTTGYSNPVPPADPEPTRYVSGAVDVQYTYVATVPLWDFPGLNIHATIPPTTIHRRAVMRVMN